ncbi:hypothetical protein CB0940_10232 [Cercospora beticola]|uniref:CBF1-interacting co-repressor CIR N-terminal domain-containing protein n=1 Tax=Cercospora beticola TaxID=122368 RepID=A0A2G5HTK0_CERBT|nr:hypothetical protein CB0940_10232 [Cercospora beticola]PIA95860.1 hypothetical protein CB0940_10232 [Cercospora beticola]
MPLHLLGKKSWNVYNTANISRVRKDEAEAQVREEAAEQRMQEEDAARRIAILRGEAVPEIPAVEDEEQQSSDRRREKNFGEDETYVSRDRKRKRRRGEDDTERDMRYAIENRERGERARETLLQGQKSTTVRDSSAAEAPLQDHTGHIQLFAPPDEKQIRSKQKNAEAEAEKAKKRKREEDLGTMKFSNAAGYNNGMQKPWYAATDNAPRQSTDTSASRNEIMLAELKGKDVWGNEDSRRKERETKRIVSSDPFAMMQSAQKQLKQSERDKEEWERRRRKELEDLKREQQRKKRRGEIDKDSLDGFSLDAPSKDDEKSEERRRRHRHHHHHRRHRSRSRDREERDRRRHRSRSRERDRDRDREQRRDRSTEREERHSRSHRHRHRE